MRIALATCNIGKIDNPPVICKQSVEYEFFYFTEENLPFELYHLNDRLKARYIKILLHRVLRKFDYYDIFIWIDGRIEITSKDFVKDYVEMLDKGKDIIVTSHPDRKNVYQEENFIIESINNNVKYLTDRYKGEPFEQELEFLKSEQLPRQFPLFASGIFARPNNKVLNKFCEDWFLSCLEFTSVDQTMFAYNIYKHKLRFQTIKFENDYFKVGKHRINKEYLQSYDLLQLTKEKILNKEPFAFIRYGDGEAMVLGGTEKETNFVLKRQLGKELNIEEIASIKNSLMLSYSNCDIIGIPTTKHLEREDNWHKSVEVLSTFIDVKNKVKSSVDVFYDFLDEKYFDNLLIGLDTLIYISCRNLDSKFKEKFGIKNIYSYIIAPEKKFTSGYVGEDHFPNQYCDIRVWMESIPIKNNLCLVGGGVVGKIYGMWFKDKGGISLDIGAVFDLFAGKATRGKNRGLDVERLDYKL